MVTLKTPRGQTECNGLRPLSRVSRGSLKWTLKTTIDAYRASYNGRHPPSAPTSTFGVAIWGTSRSDAGVVDREITRLANRGALKFVRGRGPVPANHPLIERDLPRGAPPVRVDVQRLMDLNG